MAPDTIELAEWAARTIEETLKDPRCPKVWFCPIYMLHFPQIFADGSAGPAIPILQTRYHGFLDTCIRNLTAPLTVGEKLLLRIILQKNIARCAAVKAKGDSHDGQLRDSHHIHVDDPCNLLYSMLCGILGICLSGTDGTSDSTLMRAPVNRAFDSHKPFRSTRSLWPETVDQLFPYGPGSTVERVIECCCSFTSCTALTFLIALLELARPRIWEILLQPKNLHRITWAISMTLVLTIPGCYETLALDPGLTPPGCTLPERWREANWLPERRGLQAVAHLLFALKQGNYARPDDAVRFCRPHADLLGPALRAAIEYCTELVRVVEREPRSRAVLTTVRLAVNWLFADRHCAGPQCARTMLDRADEKDKPLSTCARCRMTRYCSRTCQRSDWQAGQPVPHKVLCPVLAKLQAVADRKVVNEAAFLQYIQGNEFPDAQLALLGKWALSRGQIMQDHLRQSISTES